MCWSLEVSIIFSVIETVSVVIAAVRIWKDSKASWFERALLPTMLAVLWVELMEVIIWTDVADLDAKYAGSIECPSVNRYGTMLLILSLYAQPIAFNWACYVACYENLKRKYRTMVWLCVIAFGFRCLSRILGEVAHNQLKSGLDPSERFWGADETSIIRIWQTTRESSTGFSGLVSCSYEGINGHLHWQFAQHPFESFFPNSFFYFVVGFAVPILWMRPWAPIGLTYFLAGTILASAMLITSTTEGFSIWCWTGMFIHVFVVLGPHVRAYTRDKDWHLALALQGWCTPHKETKTAAESSYYSRTFEAKRDIKRGGRVASPTACGSCSGPLSASPSTSPGDKARRPIPADGSRPGSRGASSTAAAADPHQDSRNDKREVELAGTV